MVSSLYPDFNGYVDCSSALDLPDHLRGGELPQGRNLLGTSAIFCVKPPFALLILDSGGLKNQKRDRIETILNNVKTYRRASFP